MTTRSGDTIVLTDNDFNEESASSSVGCTRVRVATVNPQCPGLPPYIEHFSEQPPAYNDIEQMSGRAQCGCRKNQTSGDESSRGKCDIIVWGVLHIAFIGVTVGILASIVSVVAMITAQDGYKDITDKYKNAASLMHTIGSVATIPGIILFYVLYFSGRLKLSHTMREDNS